MNRFTLSVLAVMTIIIVVLSTCNSCYRGQLAELKNKPQVKVEPVEVTRIDSIKVHDTIRIEKPVPVAYIPKGYIRSIDSPPVLDFRDGPEEIHDSLYYDWLLRVKDDYFAKVAFERTIPTRYGNIIQRDTTEQNRLITGTAILDFTIPEKTVTKTLLQKKTAQVYWGVEAQGQRANFLSAFGPSLLLKTKRDNIYRVGALYNTDGFLQYQAGMYWKIKLK